MITENLNIISENLQNSAQMPVLFIGHGDPRNAILDNPFTKHLSILGKSIEPRPKAILVISAHWLTRGTFVCTNPNPETIHDFGGFPEEMYKIQYPAKGSPDYAEQVKNKSAQINNYFDWGLDHGAWTILKHLFPNADIPVFQLSIDYFKPMQYHFDLAMQLKSLRDKGLLIIGSGNIVHNLQMYFNAKDNKPFDWAIEFDEWTKNKIINKDFKSLINYEKYGRAAELSVPTNDHYVPMIYSLALSDKSESINFTYEEVLSSMSMRAFKIG